MRNYRDCCHEFNQRFLIAGDAWHRPYGFLRGSLLQWGVERLQSPDVPQAFFGHSFSELCCEQHPPPQPVEEPSEHGVVSEVSSSSVKDPTFGTADMFAQEPAHMTYGQKEGFLNLRHQRVLIPLATELKCDSV